RGSRTLTQLVGLWFAGAAAVIAFALAPFIVTPAIAVALPAIFVAGFFIGNALIATQTVTQTYAAEEFRGRALSLHTLIFRGGPALGSPIVGWLGDRFGLGSPALGGVVVFLAGGLVWRKIATPDPKAVAAAK